MGILGSLALVLWCSSITLWCCACSSYRAGFCFSDAYFACWAVPACQNKILQSQTKHCTFSTAQLLNHVGVTAVARHRGVARVGENLRSRLIQPWAQSSQHWIQTSLLWALTSWMLEASKGRQFTASWGPVPKLNYPLQVVLKATCKNFQNLKTATETIITAKRTANCSWRKLCHYTDANMESHFLLLSIIRLYCSKKGTCCGKEFIKPVIERAKRYFN